MRVAAKVKRLCSGASPALGNRLATVGCCSMHGGRRSRGANGGGAPWSSGPWECRTGTWCGEEEEGTLVLHMKERRRDGATRGSRQSAAMAKLY